MNNIKHTQKDKKKLYLGMSLLEILVVVAIFSVLGVIVTRSVLLTLRGSKRSESLVKVRENVNFSLSVVERQLRNADSIVTCPNSDTSRIDYVDEQGNTSDFSCVSIGNDGYVASASARLTNDEVDVISCSFTCDLGGGANPPSVDISLQATDADVVGVENTVVSVNTKIFLRTY